MQEWEEVRRESSHFSLSYMEIQAGKDVRFSLVGEELPMPGRRKRELHHHSHFELVFVEAGELVQHFENGSFHYQKGDACLLNRNTMHLEGFESDCKLYFVNLPPDFLLDLVNTEEPAFYRPQYQRGEVARFVQENKDTETAEYMDLAAVLENRTDTHRRVSAILKQIQEDMEKSGPGFGFKVMGQLLQLFSILEDPGCYHASRIGVDSQPETFIYTRAVAILEERHGRVSRKELGKALNYHPDHLNRVIKRQCGLSLRKLGQQIAVREAIRRMTETDQSIAQIIQDLGYTNRSHFYRLFEEETGMSPGAWRNEQNYQNRLQNQSDMI